MYHRLMQKFPERCRTLFIFWFVIPEGNLLLGLSTAGSNALAHLGWQILVASVLLSTPVFAQDIGLNPTRPTVANSAGIQNKGVLQFEAGYDAYPQIVPGNQQTVATSLSYAALDRLRLDFAWSPFNHQSDATSSTNGISTIQIGGKVEPIKEQYHRPTPGLAFQYEAELPTASRQVLQNYGQQIIVLINHHYLKDGNLDVIVNGSLVQADCQTPTGCRYGGQHSLVLSYHTSKVTRLYAELFGQNNSSSNTPPGTYFFTGFYHAFSDTVGLDGGVRFGVTDHSASIGTTIGVIFGRRIHGPAAAPPH